MGKVYILSIFSKRMQAVILAGGFGTRLRPLIKDIPKPMAPINGRPFLEYLLLMLKNKGIGDFVFCLGYLGKKIEDYFNNGENLGVSIRYSYEEQPLYSAGAVKNAEELLEKDFFVINGDDYLDIDYRRLIMFHREKDALITLATRKRDEENPRSNLLIGGGLLIEHYGKNENNLGNVAHTGVTVMNKKVLKDIKKGIPLSIEDNLFNIYAKKMKAHIYFEEGYFIDIGTPETYKKFEEDLKKGLVRKPF